MKYFKIVLFAFLLLPTLVFASATATSHLPTPVLHEVAIDAMPMGQEAKKNWKTRILERTIEKKLQKIEHKAAKKSKGDRPTAKSSLASIGLGLLSWLLLALTASVVLFSILSIATVIFGIIGLKATGANKEQGGKGWAIAGLSIGIVNIMIVLAFYVLFW